MSGGIKMVEIKCEVRQTATYTVLIFDGKQETWILKMYIRDMHKEGDRVTSIRIPEWLAIQKGLV